MDGGFGDDALVLRAWLHVIMAPSGGCSGLTVTTQYLLLSGAKDIVFSGRGEGVEWGR